MSNDSNSHFPMKKKLNPRLKYNTLWEEDPIFKGWVSVSERGEAFAFCKACNSHLAIGCTGKSDLEKHSKSKKHMSNMQYLCSDPSFNNLVTVKEEFSADSFKRNFQESENSVDHTNGERVSEIIGNEYKIIETLENVQHKAVSKSAKKYNDNWENEELFCEWISRSDKGENLAHCKACKRDLVISSGRKNLVKHAKSDRHLEMLSTFLSEYDHVFASKSESEDDGLPSTNQADEFIACNNNGSLMDLSRDNHLITSEFSDANNLNELEEAGFEDSEERLTHHVISLMLDELQQYKDDLNLKYIKKDVFKKLAVKMAQKGYYFTFQQLIDMWTTLLDRYRAIRKEKLTEKERSRRKYYSKLKELLCKPPPPLLQPSNPAIAPSQESTSSSGSTSKKSLNVSGNASTATVIKIENTSNSHGVKRTIAVDKNSNNIKKPRFDSSPSNHDLTEVLSNISSKLDNISSSLGHLVNCFAGVPSLMEKINELIDMAQERF